MTISFGTYRQLPAAPLNLAQRKPRACDMMSGTYFLDRAVAGAAGEDSAERHPRGLRRCEAFRTLSISCLGIENHPGVSSLLPLNDGTLEACRSFAS